MEFLCKREKVLEINKNIFKNKVIKVQLYEIYYNFKEMAASCKIQVKINKKKLNVVDIIYFDKDMKIKKNYSLSRMKMKKK